MQSCQLDRLPVPVSNERRRGQAQQRAAAVRSGCREGTNTGRQHHVDLTRLVGAGEVVALAEVAAHRLQRAQLVEVLVALGDDFGTGYSSLSYLGLLDVTALAAGTQGRRTECAVAGSVRAPRGHGPAGHLTQISRNLDAA
jgi:hypothetical protein